MNFTNPNAVPNLDDARKYDAVIKSHDVPKHAMDKEALEIRKTEGGIHLDNHEIVLVKKMITGQLKNLEKKIPRRNVGGFFVCSKIFYNR